MTPWTLPHSMPHRRTAQPRMHHEQPRHTRRRWWLFGFMALAALAAFAGNADASVNPMTCSNMFVTGTGAEHRYTVGGSNSGSDDDCIGRPAPFNTMFRRGAGDGFELYCVVLTSGVGVAPAAPDNTFVYAFWENAQYILGGAPTQQFFTRTYTGLCGDGAPFKLWCTDDGTATGAPRFGPIRIVIRAVRTGIGAYDVNSDQTASSGDFDAGSGTLWCDPQMTAFTDAISGGASPTTYVGGDVLRSVVTLTSQDGKPSVLGDVNLPCAGGIATAGGATFSGATVTLDTTVKGSFAVWPDDCTILQNLTITRNHALMSGFPYAHWNTTGAPVDVTFGFASGDPYAVRTAKPLDRTLAASACVEHRTVAGHPATAVAGRNEAIEHHCTWKNARSEDVPNNRLARGFVLRAGQPWRDSTDWPSADATFGASSGLAFTSTSKTTATATTGLGYRQQAETYLASRTDNELLNVGNSTGVIDVSSTWTFDGLNMSKTNFGTNTSAFVIGTDQEFAKARGLRNVHNELLSGTAVTCQRTRPDLQTETAVAMGNTDVNGDSPAQEFATIPPQGTWKMTCTATGSGNTATYVVNFFHQSAFSADTVVGVKWNVTLEPGNSTFRVNITGILRVYDPLIGKVVQSFPDENPKLSVVAFNPVTDRYDITVVDAVAMTMADGGTSASFRHVFWAPRDSLRDDFAFVSVNLTGRPFLGVEGFALQPDGDFYVLGNITVLGSATVTGRTTGTFHGDGGNLTNVSAGGAGDLFISGNLTVARNATIYGRLSAGGFRGDGSEVENVTAMSLAGLEKPSWSLLPYIVIVLAAFALLGVGAKFGPGFGVIGGVLALVGVFIGYEDDAIHPMMMTLLIVVAFICLVGAWFQRRNGTYG